MLANICKFIKCLWQNLKDYLLEQWQKLKDYFLEHRKFSLFLAGGIGIGLAFFYRECIYHETNLFELCTQGTLHSNLTLLFLGLPTFFTLWVFRTHDVQRQLDKTQESINNSTFFECVRMLKSGEAVSQKVALEQLAYLKRETGFDKKRIGTLTRNISFAKFKDRDFSFAQFSSLDLSMANLRLVYLRNANLRDANLEKAILVGADLVGADLVGANLKNTNLKGAKYSQSTEFPDGFDPDAAGMVLKLPEED